MGQQSVKKTKSAKQIQLFEQSLLNDVRALEIMLENDLIESGVNRIGAEQELFLIDRAYRPYPQSLKILQDLGDPHFTTELGSFNLEFNLDPLPFTGNCLSSLEKQLKALLRKLRQVTKTHQADVILTGILPTIRKRDLGLDKMTPKPRYYALNEAMNRLRGDHYDLFLRGIDELYIKHDSVMLEACNTSFQVHFQVSPGNFARLYNIAQVLAGPVLAVSANSPLLFGKRLWNETRIAVFQQSTDTRGVPRHIRQTPARVNFGRGWVRESVLEIFQEDIARYRVLFAAEIDENALEVLDKGGIPFLKALQLHNGTVYRWMRPCYGVTDGKAHLRIENRLFPSGPTPVDEVANAAFWLGLVKGMSEISKDVTEVFDFDEVKGNFYAAARRGLKAQFTWIKEKTIPAHKLIRKQLLPLAREGLQEAGVDESDIEKYLSVIDRRARSGQTGAEWVLRSFSGLRKNECDDKCLFNITRAAVKREKENRPVHEWPLAEAVAQTDLAKHFLKVEQFMTTDLFTVQEEDTVDFVISVMNWRRIRHIPVEDNQHRLRGLVNYRSLVQLIQEHSDRKDFSLLPIRSIMQKRIPTVTPETSTLDAIARMRKHGASCLPVVLDGRLVGIVTEHDFMNLTAQFLESKIR